MLQQVQQASLREVMQFVERERLYGLACGLLDMTMLAAELLTPAAELWTPDKRLADLAGRFGIQHQQA